MGDPRAPLVWGWPGVAGRAFLDYVGYVFDVASTRG